MKEMMNNIYIYIKNNKPCKYVVAALTTFALVLGFLSFVELVPKDKPADAEETQLTSEDYANAHARLDKFVRDNVKVNKGNLSLQDPNSAKRVYDEMNESDKENPNNPIFHKTDLTYDELTAEDDAQSQEAQDQAKKDIKTQLTQLIGEAEWQLHNDPNNEALQEKLPKMRLAWSAYDKIFCSAPDSRCTDSSDSSKIDHDKLKALVNSVTQEELEAIHSLFGLSAKESVQRMITTINFDIQNDVNFDVNNLPIGEDGSPVIAGVTWLNAGGYIGKVQGSYLNPGSSSWHNCDLGDNKDLGQISTVHFRDCSGIQNNAKISFRINIVWGKDSKWSDNFTYSDKFDTALGFQTNGTTTSRPTPNIILTGTSGQVHDALNNLSDDIVKMIGAIIGAILVTIAAAIITAVTMGVAAPAASVLATVIVTGAVGATVGIITDVIFAAAMNDKAIEDVDLNVQPRDKHDFVVSRSETPYGAYQYKNTGSELGYDFYGAYAVSKFSYVSTGYYNSKPDIHWIHTNSDGSQLTCHRTVGNSLRLGKASEETDFPKKINDGAGCDIGVQDGDEIWMTADVALGDDRKTDDKHFIYKSDATDMIGYVAQGQVDSGDEKMHLVGLGNSAEVAGRMLTYVSVAKSEFLGTMISIALNVAMAIISPIISEFFSVVKAGIKKLLGWGIKSGVAAEVASELIDTGVPHAITQQTPEGLITVEETRQGFIGSRLRSFASAAADHESGTVISEGLPNAREGFVGMSERLLEDYPSETVAEWIVSGGKTPYERVPQVSGRIVPPRFAPNGSEISPNPFDGLIQFRSPEVQETIDSIYTMGFSEMEAKSSENVIESGKRFARALGTARFNVETGSGERFLMLTDETKGALYDLVIDGYVARNIRLNAGEPFRLEVLPFKSFREFTDYLDTAMDDFIEQTGCSEFDFQKVLFRGNGMAGVDGGTMDIYPGFMNGFKLEDADRILIPIVQSKIDRLILLSVLRRQSVVSASVASFASLYSATKSHSSEAAAMARFHRISMLSEDSSGINPLPSTSKTGLYGVIYQAQRLVELETDQTRLENLIRIRDNALFDLAIMLDLEYFPAAIGEYAGAFDLATNEESLGDDAKRVMECREALESIDPEIDTEKIIHAIDCLKDFVAKEDTIQVLKDTSVVLFGSSNGYLDHIKSYGDDWGPKVIDIQNGSVSLNKCDFNTKIIVEHIVDCQIDFGGNFSENGVDLKLTIPVNSTFMSNDVKIISNDIVGFNREIGIKSQPGFTARYLSFRLSVDEEVMAQIKLTSQDQTIYQSNVFPVFLDENYQKGSNYKKLFCGVNYEVDFVDVNSTVECQVFLADGNGTKQDARLQVNSNPKGENATVENNHFVHVPNFNGKVTVGATIVTTQGHIGMDYQSVTFSVGREITGVESVDCGDINNLILWTWASCKIRLNGRISPLGFDLNVKYDGGAKHLIIPDSWLMKDGKVEGSSTTYSFAPGIYENSEVEFRFYVYSTATYQLFASVNGQNQNITTIKGKFERYVEHPNDGYIVCDASEQVSETLVFETCFALNPSSPYDGGKAKDYELKFTDFGHEEYSCEAAEGFVKLDENDHMCYYYYEPIKRNPIFNQVGTIAPDDMQFTLQPLGGQMFSFLHDTSDTQDKPTVTLRTRAVITPAHDDVVDAWDEYVCDDGYVLGEHNMCYGDGGRISSHMGKAVNPKVIHHEGSTTHYDEVVDYKDIDQVNY